MLARVPQEGRRFVRGVSKTVLNYEWKQLGWIKEPAKQAGLAERVKCGYSGMPETITFSIVRL
jgi:hypothetical protein